MSFRSRDWSAKGNTVALPNIPKMSEEKGKMKYLTDYDKYEGEFLKHHLGNADSSYTLTLQNVPAVFDRQIPSATEPTLAEREYERYVQLETQRMQKRNRAKRVARATGAIIRAASPAESEDIVPPSLFISELSSPRKVSNVDHKSRKASRTKNNTSLIHSPSTITNTTANTTSSFCKPSSSLNVQSTPLESFNEKNTKMESTSVNGNNNKSSSFNSNAHSTSNKSSIIANTRERTSLSTEVKNQLDTLLTENEKKQTNKCSPLNMKKEKKNASKLNQAWQNHREFESKSSSTSSTHHTGWDDFCEVLQRALQEEEEEGNHNNNTHLLSSNKEWQLEEDGKRVYSAEECAQWLRLLIDPPDEFVSSFDMADLDECDLRWMRVNKTPTLTNNILSELKTPRVLCNLPQYCASQHEEGTNSNKSNTLFSHTIPTTRSLTNNVSNNSKVMKINSPRSVLTLIQSGISIHDVVTPSSSSSSSASSTTLLSHNTSFSEEANTINEIRNKYVTLLSPSFGQTDTNANTPSIEGKYNSLVSITNTHSNTINKNSNLHVNDANDLIHISRIIQQHRRARVERHRQQLASQLVQSYLNLCNQVSLPELLKAYQSCISMSSYPHSSSSSFSNSYNFKMLSNSKGPFAETHNGVSEIDKTSTWHTSLQLQHQKQMKMLALHKERVQRQNELNTQVEQRQRMNEARKEQLAQEAATRAAMKQMQERQLQEERAKRFATQQNAKLEREAAIAEQLKRKMEKVQQQNERRAAQLEQTQKLRHAQRQHAEQARQVRLAQHQALLEQRAQEVEETQRIRANELVRLQKEREARLAEEHACLLARQRKAEETRMAAKQRALLQDAQVREAAREKQEEVQRRIETFNTERQRALELKRQQEKEKEAQRHDVKESAHMAELEWQTKLHEEQLAQERILASIKQHKMLQCIVRNERERDEAAAKAFVVARHRRRNEFNKLLVATELMKKQSAAEFVSLERNAMLAEMRKEREVLNDERDALKQQMEEQNTIGKQP